MADNSFTLGAIVDPATGDRLGEVLTYAPEDRLAMEREQLLDLESDLARDVEEFGARWDAAAIQIEELAIGLERSNVRVEPLKLLWLPVDDSA
ncbi:MAG: hypothetical protein WD204_06240 [Acidimicrobiia bacterium]